MAVITYAEKLKDPRWQKRRLTILDRDEWHCQMCFDSETMLVVHHRYYTPGAQPWEYPDEALITLCDNCHRSEHECEGVFKNLKQALSKAGAFTKEAHNLSVVFDGAGLLNEYEWSVLELELIRLLASHKENGPEWDQARDRAAEVWRVKAVAAGGKSGET